jgi:outer membrane lipoprotein-sorting protein
MAISQRTLKRAFLFLGWSTAAVAQNAAVSQADLVKRISQRYQEAKQYSFEGDLEIARRSGTEKPKEPLLHAKVRLTVAPPAKFLLRVEPAMPNTKSSYILVSDGQKNWTYVSSAKRYTESDVSFSPTQHNLEAGLDLRSQDLAAEFSRRVVDILAGLAVTADVTDLKGSVLMVLSKKDGSGRQNMTYLTLDTATLDLRRMSWLNAIPSENGDKTLVRSDLAFESFRIGEPINDSDFTFHPPKEAKRVDSLPMIRRNPYAR